MAKEAKEAKRTNKFLPCRIEVCALPGDFASADTINLSEWDASPRDHKLDRLIEEIGRKLGRDPAMDFRRMKELEETWRAYGAPSLVRFALSEGLTPEAKEPPPTSAKAVVAPILGDPPKAMPTAVRAGAALILADPPKGISPNLAQVWEMARVGNANALVTVGYAYCEGRDGLSNDDREAARLYRLAVEQGNFDALSLLATMHEAGRGVPRNDREAVRLYRLAAEKGNVMGQERLGWMYENGLAGLSKNRTEAVRFYKRAARKKSKLAISHLKRLGESW